MPIDHLWKYTLLHGVACASSLSQKYVTEAVGNQSNQWDAYQVENARIYNDAVVLDITAKAISESEFFCEKTLDLMENIISQLG